MLSPFRDCSNKGRISSHVWFKLLLLQTEELHTVFSPGDVGFWYSLAEIFGVLFKSHWDRQYLPFQTGAICERFHKSLKSIPRTFSFCYYFFILLSRMTQPGVLCKHGADIPGLPDDPELEVPFQNVTLKFIFDRWDFPGVELCYRRNIRTQFKFDL